MKTVVILCGGQGERYKNSYNNSPKALAPIGNMPILWHLFMYFEQYGLRRFILCLGNQGEEIRNYVKAIEHDDWDISCIDTGIDTPTGGRIKQIEKYVANEDHFLATYVDGLSNLNIQTLTEFALKADTIATLTSIRPRSQYGILEISESDKVLSFEEKPPLPFYINGGFFVFKSDIFDFLDINDELEVHTFRKLIAKNELTAFKHNGFWKSMDTFKDNQTLDEAWQNGNAEWKIW